MTMPDQLLIEALGMHLIRIRTLDPLPEEKPQCGGDKDCTNCREMRTMRDSTILASVGLAQTIGMDAGLMTDPESAEHVIGYIELPSGQVSWRLPLHPNRWDGHSTTEKWNRVTEYVSVIGLHGMQGGM